MIIVKVKLDKSGKEEEKIKKIKTAKNKYVKESKKIAESKDKFVEENKKINESKRKIRLEKKKIQEEKDNINKKKIESFSKTKVGKIFGKVRTFLRIDKCNYTFTDLIIVTIFSLVVGGVFSFCLMVILCGGKNYFTLSRDLKKFVEVYDTITNSYYEDVDKVKLVDGAISGMMSGVGDIYTSYSDKDSASQFDETVTGSYEGIGCTIQLQEHGVAVIEVFEDSPSYKAGLLAGDIILFVDDKDVSTMSVSGLADYIKYESESNIKMIISRDGEEKEINLVRGKVETPVVSSTIYENNGKKIGYLSISMFTSASTSQFEKKIKSLESKGIDSLIIDVRNNSGGYLSSVTDILSMLLPKNSVIYQTHVDGKLTATKDRTSSKREYPIAVLVNEGSASASEILAAAIKESYKGLVVGTKTYGKGTVQQVKKLSDGSMIKYTIDKWLTPEGIWINEVGLMPTNEVEMASEYYDNPVVENDNQLQTAIKLVSE